MPEGLKDIVVPIEKGWLLASPRGSVNPAMWATLSLLLTSGLALVTTLLFLIEDLGGLASGPLFMLLTAGAALLTLALMVNAARPHPIRLDGRGISKIPFARPLRLPQRVRVYGRVGEALRLEVRGSTTQTLLQVSPRHLLIQEGWTFENVHWFAEALASRWGVPFDNELDAEAWNAWLSEPTYRAYVLFCAKRTESQNYFPAWHALPPAQSAAVYTHHGLKWDALRIDTEFLFYAGDQVPLHDIREVSVYFNRPTAGAVPQGRILLLTGLGTFEVGRVSIYGNEDASRLLAIADLIEAHASNAHKPDPRGTADEIPAPLHALRSP